MHQFDAADLAELRGDVDDNAALCRQHRPQHGLAAQKRAAHMHGKHPVEIGGRQVDETGLMHVPGIVDQNRAIPECGLGRGHQTGDIAFNRDIAGHRKGLAAKRHDFARHRLGARPQNIIDGDRHPVPGKAMGNSPANAGTGPGDDGNRLAHQLSSCMAKRLARRIESVIRMA